MHKPKGLLVFTGFLTIFITASLACGVSDLPNPFATDTPTPTLTFTPTLTPTPTATPTSTPTRTPTATPRPSGVIIETQSDGTSLLIDYDNMFQLVLPEGWVVIPIQKADLEKMLDEVAKENPNLAEAAEAFKDLDPNVIRAVALNTDPDVLQDGRVSNLNIAAIDNPMLVALPLSFITGAFEESFTQQGFKVLSTGVNIIDNPSGLEIQYIDVEQTQGGVKIQQRMLLFQANEKLITITISTQAKFTDEIFPIADAIGASVEILK